MARDDFTGATKRVLSDRVQGFCSNPACGAQTKGPHSDDEKVNNVGTASHIHAASPGGPRYDPAQTQQERSAHANGIWLCRKCGTLIDTDANRYPADLLRSWKHAAETKARLRLETHSSEALLECGDATTREVLRWPTTLPDGTWIERRELDQLLAMVRDDDVRPIVLLGAPGSGKSALLARFGSLLHAEGVQVVAIKADRLPATVGTARELRDHLGFPIPVASAICALGNAGPTVLIIDQLDALSDLVDVKTERLSVLLNLIESVAGAENVRIVCSARLFDYRHDTRFERLAPRELRLELPDIGVVDQALSAAGHIPQETPDELRQLLRTPQWLKAFLGLGLANRGSLPTTWHALLERVWQRDVAGVPGTPDECEIALRVVAKEMAAREELWIPRAVMQSHGTALDLLVSRGVLVVDERGHRIGFTHQLLYEFARARTFLGDESLVDYVGRSQNSLFVRPTLWTALGYLRTADHSKYAADLAALWASELRRHVRLLLVEFLGQQEDPDDHEASLLLPLLQDPSWQQATFSAVAGSRGWFERLKRGYLRGPMTGRSPGLVIQVLSAAVRSVPDEALALVRANWGSRDRFVRCTLDVLRHLEVWNEDAFALADEAVAASGARHDLDGLVWRLKGTQPQYAIRLVARSLDRELTRILRDVAPSQPLALDATEEERIAWQVNREPRHSLDNLLSSVSSRHSYLCELADSAPGVVLDNLLPWLSKLVTSATEPNPNHGWYVDDHLLGSKPVDDLPRELADALRIAAQSLSGEEPLRFLELVSEWKSSELMSIHVALSFGLEVVAGTDPASTVDYLLEDPRRLCIGDFQDNSRYTVALLSRLGPVLSRSQAARLEDAIKSSAPASAGTDRPVESRRCAQQFNRRHRLKLLRALPESLLSTETRALVDQERRTFGEDLSTGFRSRGFRAVGSPMGAAEMAQARDQDIVNLFSELVDSTHWDHPRRWLEGGSVQAAREFAAFAKSHPERAIAISGQFHQGQQENPAGEMLRALAETELPTQDLEALAASFDRRGFTSEEFRTDAAWALEKRASGLSDATVDMLASWIRDAAQETAGELQEDRGHPPFLWGMGGGGVLPRGSYPMLSAVTVTLLSRTPPDAEKWLDLLEKHLERNDSLEIWLPFSRYLRWLCLADATRAAAFLDGLLEKYREVLESADGVRLLADASWWLPQDQLRRLVLRLREGSWPHGNRAFGELVGFLGVREPAVDWARAQLTSLLNLDDATDRLARVGVAGICVDLWTSSWREACTSVLERLAENGSRTEREQILSGLHPSEVMVDDESRRLLIALARDPEAFFATHSGLALEWVSSLVHSYPTEVRTLVEGLVSALETRGTDAPYVHAGLDTLVNLSITMQRLPQHREAGLNIFERLLTIGFYGARRALDEADAWPRYRRAL